MSGYGKLGGAFLSPAVPDHDPSIELASDTATARKLIAEAKAEGINPSFTISTIAGNTYASLSSQVIQQNLEEVGFSVKLEPIDESTLFSNLGAGEYEASEMNLYPSVLDASENTAFYIGTEGLFTRAPLGQIENLAAAASTETNPTKRRNIYYEIQQKVAGQGYMVTVAYEPYVWAMQSNVAGFAVNPLNITWLADVGFAGS